jgi:hypothetical protein
LIFISSLAHAAQEFCHQIEITCADCTNNEHVNGVYNANFFQPDPNGPIVAEYVKGEWPSADPGNGKLHHIEDVEKVYKGLGGGSLWQLEYMSPGSPNGNGGYVLLSLSTFSSTELPGPESEKFNEIEDFFGFVRVTEVNVIIQCVEDTPAPSLQQTSLPPTKTCEHLLVGSCGGRLEKYEVVILLDSSGSITDQDGVKTYRKKFGILSTRTYFPQLQKLR